jgi:hypothetical protein
MGEISSKVSLHWNLMRQFILQVAPGGRWFAISWRGSALMLPMRQDGPTF